MRTLGTLWLLCLHLSLNGQIDFETTLVDHELLTDQSDAILLEDHHHDWLLVVDTSDCLTPIQRRQITQFIYREQPISPYELQVADGLSVETLSCIVHALNNLGHRQTKKIEPGKTRMSLLTSWKGDLSNFTPNINDINLLFRVNGTPTSQLKYGILLEKDPSERLWTRQKKLEHLGGYISYYPASGPIRELIIGDHRLTLGQGMMFNNFYRKGLSFSDVSLPKYQSGTVATYQSLDENRALRGLAIKTGSYKNLDLLASMSLRQLDARIDSLTGMITSFPLSGLHTSESALDTKDAAASWTGALSLAYRQTNWSVVLNGLVHGYSQTISQKGQLYAIYRYSGKRINGLSLSFDYHKKSFNYYGEIMLDRQNKPNWVLGILWSPRKGHRFSLVHRNLSPFHSYPFMQSLTYGSGTNENGVFLGYYGQISRAWSIHVNFDSRLQRWWSYLNAPFRRSDQAQLTLRYKKRKHHEAYFTFRMLQRHRDTNGMNQNSSMKESKLQFRVHAMKVITKGIEWRTRFQYNQTTFGTTSWGWLGFQELKFKPLGSPWSISARLSAFNIGSYDARIYAYEVRAGNLFALPAFSGRGHRTFINAKYSLGKTQIGLYVGQQHTDETTIQISSSLKVSF